MTSPDSGHDAKHDLTVHKSRVMLYAPCFIDAEAALGLATELARQIGADLYGVLVCDTTAFVAGRSQSTVVSYGGEPATGVTIQTMQKAFQADAKRFRDRLQREAQAATLKAVFQETEGRLTEALERESGASDVLVVGFKPVTRSGSALVAILDEGRAPPDYARTLANRLQKPLVTLTSGAGSGDLLARLNRMSPAAVLLVASQAALPPLSRIVETARCPVIVWREPV